MRIAAILPTQTIHAKTPMIFEHVFDCLAGSSIPQMYFWDGPITQHRQKQHATNITAALIV